MYEPPGVFHHINSTHSPKQKNPPFAHSGA